jgi:hypothetical protein
MQRLPLVADLPPEPNLLCSPSVDMTGSSHVEDPPVSRPTPRRGSVLGYALTQKGRPIYEVTKAQFILRDNDGKGT